MATRVTLVDEGGEPVIEHPLQCVERTSFFRNHRQAERTVRAAGDRVLQLEKGPRVARAEHEDVGVGRREVGGPVAHLDAGRRARPADPDDVIEPDDHDEGREGDHEQRTPGACG